MHLRARPTALVVVLAALGGATLLPLPAHGTDGPGALRQKIAGQKSREQQLASAADRLGQLERATGREIAILTQRLGAAQADLAAWQGRLADTQRRLRDTSATSSACARGWRTGGARSPRCCASATRPTSPTWSTPCSRRTGSPTCSSG
jgi:hypothetical protein